MAWKVEVDSEKGFIHTVYSGVVTKDDILDSMAETVKMLSGKGRKNFYRMDRRHLDLIHNRNICHSQ